MEYWQKDLLGVSEGAFCEHATFKKIQAAARALGFEQCAFGLQLPCWSTGSRTIVLNNYAAPEWLRFIDQEFLQHDPRDPPGYCNLDPKAWNEKVWLATTAVRDEALAIGRHVGWLQSSAIAFGLAGILTLSRSDELLSSEALASRADHLRWLVKVSHMTLCGILASKPRETVHMSKREIDVLRWSADGKTTSEVAQIMALSENTIKFHIKNAASKLGRANKVAAVARAVRIGLLN